MSPTRPAAVVVLAAGEGTRMRSESPKVLHEVCGRTLLGHVVASARTLEPEHLLVVVGQGRKQVEAHLAELDPDAVAVVQEPQAGTGHAVRTALDAVGDLDGTVVVLNADVPLLTPPTLASLVDAHEAGSNAATVLSARVPDPAGYGRIVRDAAGDVASIVEHADATADQLAHDEINAGLYAFDAKPLRAALTRLVADNTQDEEYLTDVLGILAADGLRVAAVPVPDHREVLGVNDRAQLAAVHRILRDRLLDAAMRSGVTVIDPATTWVDVDVRLDPDCVIRPNTQLYGATHVASGAEVGPNCSLRDTYVGADARVSDATCEDAEIGPGATVGPYAYLRPGTRLGPGAKAGSYVEIKNADVGAGSKVPHLSYVGDATIGEHANIGAATVFVNYDGVHKHRTTIGDHARTGADNMFVAPVSVGPGAYTAAGSVITDDVPAGAMGVGRARQRNVEGWVERKRPGTAAAAAAARARGAAEPDADADPEDVPAPDTSATDVEGDAP